MMLPAFGLPRLLDTLNSPRCCCRWVKVSYTSACTSASREGRCHAEQGSSSPLALHLVAALADTQAVCLRSDLQTAACWSAQAAAAGSWLPSCPVLSTDHRPPALQVICWVLGEYGTCAGASAQSVIDKLAAIIDAQVGHRGSHSS